MNLFAAIEEPLYNGNRSICLVYDEPDRSLTVFLGGRLTYELRYRFASMRKRSGFIANFATG